MSRRVGFFVFVFLTLSVPAAAETDVLRGLREQYAFTLSAPSGEIWLGRDAILGDFSIVWLMNHSDGFTCILTPVQSNLIDSPWVRYGLKIASFGRHLSATLYDGRPVRGYNGTISPDGRLVWGTCWDLPDSTPSSPGRAIWWATIDTGSQPAPPRQFDLNTVTVGELMAAGLSSVSARTIVEGRLFGGPYRSVGEALLAPDLSEPEQKIIRERGLVR